MTLEQLLTYDRIVVAFSGGKDSIAAVLWLLALGVPKAMIELHHHDVDGGAEEFMDWPCTPAYCRAFAEVFGLPLFFSHKVGGFDREMMRKDSATAPIAFQDWGGEWKLVGGNGPLGTRLRYPQVAADLKVRWCSAYLKIDVMDTVLRNSERFLNSRTLVVTGERAEESPNRARYKDFEDHRADTRESKRKPRHIDHWRPVKSWSEQRVWETMQSWGVVPHVAYQLGWPRLSCQDCIFGSPNQVATNRLLFPDRFNRHAGREQSLGVTINRKLSLNDLADRGTPYQAAIDRPDLVAVAKGTTWPLPIRISPKDWTLPAGAFGEGGGPT